MSIRTRILGSVAAAMLAAGLGLATVPAGAEPPVADVDDFKLCQENYEVAGDDCPDHEVDEPEAPPVPEPEDDDTPKPGRPDFTG